MENLKFKAWIKKQNKITEVKAIFFKENNTFVETKHNIYNIKEVHLMQHIGLKDRNGDEIYEGHILKDIYTGKRSFIHFINGNFYLIDDGNYFSSLYCLDTKYYDIAGYVYDDKELLQTIDTIKI
ncbi:hypothetical protein F1B92_06470 [Campylobacter sp. FMV-PI01]|uniref:YopX protein domain-containing protein n=1 Tax=Campylobacter portucalensis TaxID=2608384 RepID=A0A6L5WHT4_9BACT|nr:YopX family protein [Campylobacter portucalensis]MSN96808.1 hypothetical protein [Campylobacter portucalensis]